MKLRELISDVPKDKTLYIGKNKTEDFVVAICAASLKEARQIAKGYQNDTHMEGGFVVKSTTDLNVHVDCDYILK